MSSTNETNAWCVQTESGRTWVTHHQGYAPINVWEDGWLIPVRYWHRLGLGELCPRCIDGPPRDEVMPDHSGDYCLVPFHHYHQKFKEKKQEERAA